MSKTAGGQDCPQCGETEQPIQKETGIPMPSEWSDRTWYGKLWLLIWLPVWILAAVLLVAFLGSMAVVLGGMYVLVIGLWKLQQARDWITPEVYKDE